MPTRDGLDLVAGDANVAEIAVAEEGELANGLEIEAVGAQLLEQDGYKHKVVLFSAPAPNGPERICCTAIWDQYSEFLEAER